MKQINKIVILLSIIMFVLVGSNTVLAAKDWNSGYSNKASKAQTVPNPIILDKEIGGTEVLGAKDESNDVSIPQGAGEHIDELLDSNRQVGNNGDLKRELDGLKKTTVEKRQGMEARERKGMETRERKGMEIRDRMAKRTGMEARQGMGVRENDDSSSEKKRGNDPIPDIDMIVKLDPSEAKPLLDEDGNELDVSIEAVIKRAVQENKNEWAKPPVEELSMIAIAGKDAEVEAVKLNENNTMTIKAKQKVSLFGFIPFDIGIEVMIEPGGEVKEVNKPWYSFLLW